MKEIQFLDENPKQILGKTFLDFSKIVLAAAFASEFFSSVSKVVGSIAYIVFSVFLIIGVWLNRKETQ